MKIYLLLLQHKQWQVVCCFRDWNLKDFQIFFDNFDYLKLILYLSFVIMKPSHIVNFEENNLGGLLT